MAGELVAEASIRLCWLMLIRAEFRFQAPRRLLSALEFDAANSPSGHVESGRGLPQTSKSDRSGVALTGAGAGCQPSARHAARPGDDRSAQPVLSAVRHRQPAAGPEVHGAPPATGRDNVFREYVTTTAEPRWTVEAAASRGWAITTC